MIRCLSILKPNHYSDLDIHCSITNNNISNFDFKNYFRSIDFKIKRNKYQCQCPDSRRTDNYVI